MLFDCIGKQDGLYQSEWKKRFVFLRKIHDYDSTFIAFFHIVERCQYPAAGKNKFRWVYRLARNPTPKEQ